MSNEHSNDRRFDVMIRLPDGQRLDGSKEGSPSRSIGPHGTEILGSDPPASRPHGTRILPDPLADMSAPPSVGTRPQDPVLSEEVHEAFCQLTSVVFNVNDKMSARAALSFVNQFERRFITNGLTLIGNGAQRQVLAAKGLESLVTSLEAWTYLNDTFALLANELREVRDEPSYISELQALRRLVETHLSWLTRVSSSMREYSALKRDYETLSRETQKRITDLQAQAADGPIPSYQTWLGRFFARIANYFG